MRSLHNRFPTPTLARIPQRLRDDGYTYVARCLLLASLLMPLGCESKDAQACREQYLKSHGLISAQEAKESKELDGVQQALEAVDSAIPLCKKANLHKEVAELEKAQRTLQSSANQLRTYMPRKELSPEELDKLVKDGDPNCPKGQAYNYRKTGKQVKCTGPQVVAFTRGQAEEYFKNRGFRVKAEGTRIDAEFGPESYHYEFSGADANAKSQCLRVLAMPGMTWEESVSRVTGAHPMHLKKGTTVRAEDGSKWPLAHVENEKQAEYRLGKCGE